MRKTNPPPTSNCSQCHHSRKKKASPDVKTNPTSARPRLIDPQSRTAMLPVRQAVRVELIASPSERSAALGNAGWQASKD